MTLSDGYTAESVAAHIETVGRALGREAEAARLTEAFETDIATVEADIARISEKPRVLFILQTGRGASMVSGTGTAAHAMVELPAASTRSPAIAATSPSRPRPQPWPRPT